MNPGLSFTHRFVSANDPSKARTLLLLHGTGGDEDDLIDLGRQLDPDANLLSPRGRVLENGMNRFFRRLAEGVFDEEDVKLRVSELADFIRDASKHYHFDLSGVIAVGYSNGANTAAALLLLRPQVLAGAVLFRAMLPLQPNAEAKLDGKHVLIVEGDSDTMIPRDGAETLARVLQKRGAMVKVSRQEAGHGLTEGDVDVARGFLESFKADGNE